MLNEQATFSCRLKSKYVDAAALHATGVEQIPCEDESVGAWRWRHPGVRDGRMRPSSGRRLGGAHRPQLQVLMHILIRNSVDHPAGASAALIQAPSDKAAPVIQGAFECRGSTV